MTAVEPLRAVLLDLDGTLLDPGRRVFGAVTAAAATLGLPSPNQALPRRFIGPRIRSSCAELLRLKPSNAQVATSHGRTSLTARHAPQQRPVHRCRSRIALRRPATKSGRADDPTRLRLQDLP